MSALAALATLGGALIGAHTSSQNSREVNRLNYRQFKELQAYNERMWHMQNRYNTPNAQRLRLEQAGINPAIALGNISTGNAQAVQSASPAPAVGNDAGNILANGIAQGSNALLQGKQIAVQEMLAKAQARAQNADAQGKEIDNGSKDERNRAEIASLNKMMERADAEIARIKTLQPEELKKLQAEVQNIWSQMDVNHYTAELKKFELGHIAPAQLQEIASRIALNFSTISYQLKQGIVSEAQAFLLGKHAIESELRANGVRMDNSYKHRNQYDAERLVESQLNINKETARKLSGDADQSVATSAWTHVREFTDIFAKFIPLAGGSGR